MIYDDWANWLNLFSMIAMLGLISLVAQVISLRYFLFFCQKLAPLQQKWMILVWATLPFMLMLTTLVPGLSSSQIHNQGTVVGPFGFIHWHHTDLFIYTGWHGWLLVAVSVWCVSRFAMFVYSQWQLIRRIKLLNEQGSSDTSNNIMVLPTRDVIAMTIGYLTPQIYVSNGLLEQSSPEQQRIIFRHEAAHLRYRDNLARCYLDFMTYLLPDILRKPLLQRFTLVTEHIADHHAAATSDPNDVADTLIAVARLQLQSLPQTHGQAYLITSDQLNDRIQELLAPSQPARFHLWLLILILGLMASGALSAIDAIHHLFDQLLAH